MSIRDGNRSRKVYSYYRTSPAPTEVVGPQGEAGAAGAQGEAGQGLNLTPAGGVAMTGPNSGSLDYTLYTNSTGDYVLVSGIVLKITTTLTGSGVVSASIGLTAGAQEFMTTQIITSGTSPGMFGVWQSQLGTRFPSSQDYNAVLTNGESVVARLTGSGSITQSTSITAHVLGIPI